MSEQTFSKFCIFPDDSKFKIDRIISSSEQDSCVSYFDDNLKQVLWVPNDFIKSLGCCSTPKTRDCGGISVAG